MRSLWAKRFTANDRFTVDIPVTNTGAYDGKHAVLGFVQCPYAKLTRPVKELRFFDKKEIKTGQTVVYHFNLQVNRDLGFVNDEGNTVVEPGTYRLLIGDQTITLNVK